MKQRLAKPFNKMLLKDICKRFSQVDILEQETFLHSTEEALYSVIGGVFFASISCNDEQSQSNQNVSHSLTNNDVPSLNFRYSSVQGCYESLISWKFLEFNL